jgi:Papain family cysteine protease
VTYIRRYTPVDSRLGRHVRHDSRSERYAVGVLPKHAIKKVQWTRRIPILDQLQLGKCTAEATTGVLGTDNALGQGQTSVTLDAAAAGKSSGFLATGAHPLDDTFSTAFYSVETRGDAYPGQYPPTDTGSDALGAMKATELLGLVTKYQHAFSYAAAVSAVQSGPLMWGTEWLNSMFTPDSKGYLVVDTASGVAGGHELVLSGYDPDTDEWNIDNSWNESWGLDGSARITGAKLTYLLKQQGDVTLPTFATVAPPTPTPPAPPAPPSPVIVTDAQLWADAQSWAHGKGLV